MSGSDEDDAFDDGRIEEAAKYRSQSHFISAEPKSELSKSQIAALMGKGQRKDQVKVEVEDMGGGSQVEQLNSDP